MRPTLLDPLFAEAERLPGIGPKSALLLNRLLVGTSSVARVIDVLFHLPVGVVDRRARPTIIEAIPDTVVTLDVRVSEHRPPPARSKAPYRVLVEDATGDCLLVFFLTNHDWIARSLPLGARRFVSGKLELWDGYRQIVHPDRVMNEAELARMPAVEPVYALTEGLFQRMISRACAGALARVPAAMPEWQNQSLMQKRGWPSFAEALKTVHMPAVPADIAPESPARTRLAYDELLAHQLSLLLVRAQMRKPAGRQAISAGQLQGKILGLLPFAPTDAQMAALAEICADMASDKRMLRLLQGDVGSGKTLVAMLAMAHVVEAGRQAAMMAPTEILARQHFQRLEPMARAAGIRLACLTGRDRAAERAHTLAQLANGDIDIVLGTHALFQDSVVFANLGLAVVDEQHRFGVEQRLALGAKGEGVDVLVMTATPIPRTLVLTHFGDMDVSILDEKPAGRSPIDTRALPMERLDEVVAGIARAIKSDQRVYWICPLVSESEALDLAAAAERSEMLGQFFGSQVGLIHGQMPPRDKDAAMEAFQSGKTKVLVATTVVEVGVDVPEASIIVIEHAERFGLAQLHQLRGRVGRGAARSTCLLLYRGPLGENAAARINTLRETQDGFVIAEQDLRLRGEGEVLGLKQSGLPNYRLADLSVHHQLLQVARDDAKLLLSKDADLATARGEAARTLLYVFDRVDAVRLLRAG